MAQFGVILVVFAVAGASAELAAMAEQGAGRYRKTWQTVWPGPSAVAAYARRLSWSPLTAWPTLAAAARSPRIVICSWRRHLGATRRRGGRRPLWLSDSWTSGTTAAPTAHLLPVVPSAARPRRRPADRTGSSVVAERRELPSSAVAPGPAWPRTRPSLARPSAGPTLAC